MPPELIAQLLLGGGAGIAQILSGKKMAKHNVRPILNESGQYKDELGMFEQQAQYGIDKNALTFATEKNQDALSGSLATLLQAGGDPNMVSGLFGQYADQMEKLAQADSQAKWQKVNAVSAVNDKLFEAKREEFLYNKDAPYKDTAQLAAAKQQQGFQELFGTLDSVMGNSIKSKKNYQDSSTVNRQPSTEAPLRIGANPLASWNDGSVGGGSSDLAQVILDIIKAHQ